MADRGSPSLLSALRVRCPVCDHKPITSSYGEIVPVCPSCGYAFDKGEEGYYVGALIVNMAVCLLAFFVTFVGTMLLTWPDVPWNALLVLCLVVMVVVPVWFYPRSKTLWIWLDLRSHPWLGRDPEDAEADAPR